MDRQSRTLQIAWFVAFAALAASGLALGWNKGQLPRRDSAPAAAGEKEELAADLALYCEVIGRVRGGENYYSAAADTIPQYGFPISSPLNWRLPTYAWLLSRLPCIGWIQLTLIGLSLAAAGVAIVAKGRAEGPLAALLSGLLFFGVIRWAADGYACVAQEPWAAALVLLSLGSVSLSERDRRFSLLAIGSGLAALFFRELALPYCAAACAVAVNGRRWREASGWGAGIATFFAFYAWHAGQIQAYQPAGAVAAEPGVSQWLRAGGLDFVLLTTRMNGLVFGAWGAVLWLYLLAALLGLALRPAKANQVACLAALGYIVAFAFLGRPENFYWGLLPAPLLAWGVASAPGAIRQRIAELVATTAAPAAAQQKSAAGTNPAALA